MTVTFELDGQPFVALNGGPEFTFDEAAAMLEMKKIDIATLEQAAAVHV